MNNRFQVPEWLAIVVVLVAFVLILAIVWQKLQW